jgi:hypothetical protein
VRCFAGFLGADVFITNDFVATLQEDIHIPTKLTEAQNIFHVIAQVTRRHDGDIDSCDSLRSVPIWLKLLAWRKRKGP